MAMHYVMLVTTVYSGAGSSYVQGGNSFGNPADLGYKMITRGPKTLEPT